MKIFITFIFCFYGLWLLFSAQSKNVPTAIKKAVKNRNQSGKGDIQLMFQKVSKKLEPHIKINEEKRQQLTIDLAIVNSTFTTAEGFVADVIVTSGFYSLVGIALMIFSIPFAIVVTGIIFFVSYNWQIKSLKRQLIDRRKAIEAELPQLAGTIRQQLNSTRDIVSILESYRKICGKNLKSEITKTLNDIKTGNAEKALQAFSRRIGSSKLSELIRGLIGVLQGEEQKMYFEILTEDYIKAQSEDIKKQLEQRPNKLTINFACIIACVFLIAMVSMSGEFSAMGGMF